MGEEDRITRRGLSAAALAATGLAAASPLLAQPRRPPIVIARGGAAGGWPAETKGAYDQAANDGADFLESGLVPTKEGILIARQDDELSGDTNVAARPEFADRRATRVIDGVTREGWFCEDFTLAEIKSLAPLFPGGQDRRPAAERAQRPAILTFDELMAIARAGSVRQARVVGVYAVLKHPKYFARLDLPLEAPVATAIRAQGYNSPAAAMFVGADDEASLKALGEATRARRVRIVGGGPGADFGPGALHAMATRAVALAVPASLLLDASVPKTLRATAILADIHAAGLAVHAFAGGAGETFPPPPLKPGDARRAMAALFAGGVDGVLADLASPAARARSDALAPRGG